MNREGKCPMIKNALETLAPPTLVRERAIDHVRDAIISGRIPPGTRLIERELCEAMGISRASVREVIRRLEAEKLLQVEPRRGPTVTRLGREEAREIYEVRALLEGLLFRRFTMLAAADDKAVLRSFLKDLGKAAARGAIDDILALTRRLNMHLVTVARHKTAHDLLEHLDARISLLRVRAMAKPGRLAESIEELEGVVAAVERADPEGAALAISASVMKACDAALEQLPS
jgi:DNA-binding GntR family transcriptional regulator